MIGNFYYLRSHVIILEYVLLIVISSICHLKGAFIIKAQNELITIAVNFWRVMLGVITSQLLKLLFPWGHLKFWGRY